VPFVAGPGQPPTDDVGELLAKLEPPLADRLVADLDAPERQHLLNHSKAEREPEVQPNRVADQLGRKAMAGVKGIGRARHAGLITDPRPSGKPARRQLDGADDNALRSYTTSQDAFQSPAVDCAQGGAPTHLGTVKIMLKILFGQRSTIYRKSGTIKH
jgi:hypothetical protein